MQTSTKLHGGPAGVREDAPRQAHSQARVQLKSALSGLPAREQMAMLRPARPPMVVQKQETTDNRPTIAKLDAKNLAEVVKALKAGGVWAHLVDAAKAATSDGAKPIDPSVEDDILLEALIFVESHFQFADGVSLDDMLFDASTRRLIVGAIAKEASPEPTPAEEPPKVPIPAAGTFGMVTRDTALTKSDGSKLALKAGDAIESKGEQDGQLRVLVHSGKEVEGTIDPAVFKAQPRIATDDKTGKTEDHTYQKYEGELFLGEPSIKDVDQGALGDCFLIAAMGAVAAANPDLIKKAVVYNGDETFTVTFQELQRDGTFKPHPVVVDAYLPTRQGSGDNRTAYALSDTSFDPKNQALWPAIIEKAYAQWKGGYSGIQSGGQSAKAMEALTGVRSVRASMPKEEDVIATFKTYQLEGKAVVCGTRDWIQQTSVQGLLSGSGDGPYSGALKDKEGNAAEVVKGTVTIRDAGGKAGTARDDSSGGFRGTGVDSGEIDYANGATKLTYKKDKGPAKAEELEATYRFEGTLDHGLNVHGNHAYMFSQVQGTTLLFRNPWGPAEHKHPKPLSAADFLRLFETLGVNAVIPQQAE